MRPDRLIRLSPMSVVATLVRTIAGSIANVGLICIAGYLLARKGILNPGGRKVLNRANALLLTPCLLFAKVAFYVSLQELRQLWIVPVVFSIIVVVSGLSAWTLGMLLRLSRPQRNFAVVTSVCMNTNSLPFALLQSLVQTSTTLQWGDEDTQSAMSARAFAYLVLYSSFGMTLMWSFGAYLLSRIDHDSGNDHNGLAAVAIPAAQTTENGAVCIVISEVGEHKGKDHRPLTASGESISASPIKALTVDEEHGEYAASSIDLQTASPMHRGQQVVVRQLQQVLSRVRRFMTAPLCGSLLGIVVTCIQPLQRLLTAHLSPVTSAINSLADCCVPITLVVLGAYFFRVTDSRRDVDGQQSHPRWRSVLRRLHDRMRRRNRSPPGETRTVIVSILARMVVAPAICFPLLYLLIKHKVARTLDDPVFLVGTAILTYSPPAITLAQMSQYASGETYERLIRRTISWAYLLCTAPLTVGCVMLALKVLRQ